MLAYLKLLYSWKLLLFCLYIVVLRYILWMHSIDVANAICQGPYFGWVDVHSCKKTSGTFRNSLGHSTQPLEANS